MRPPTGCKWLMAMLYHHPFFMGWKSRAWSQRMQLRIRPQSRAWRQHDSVNLPITRLFRGHHWIGVSRQQFDEFYGTTLDRQGEFWCGCTEMIIRPVTRLTKRQGSKLLGQQASNPVQQKKYHTSCPQSQWNWPNRPIFLLVGFTGFDEGFRTSLHWI